MSLRYKFHHLFYGGKVNKKRLYEILEDLDTSSGGDTSDLEASIEALEDAIGDESTEGTILARIKALEDA